MRVMMTTALLAALIGLSSAQAQAQAPAANPNGTSPIDLSNPSKSGQDANLRGHPVPPIAPAADRLPLGRIKLPPGFRAEVWSSGHAGGRTMVQGAKGTIFMGSRVIGRVYAVVEKDGRREVKILLQGLTQPNGLAFRDGSLYVFAINRVYRYDNIEEHLDKAPEPVDLTAAFNLPPEIHHNWKYVDFGPDGKLYVQVGANCNICELNPGIYAQIRRYNADGTGMEIVARGVRNTVGFDWHPQTKELWFTDNGRDWAGNDGPQDELNRIPADKQGANFGFPYCHANGIPDPDIRKPDSCAGVIMPAALNGPHAAGLGIRFYTGSMFPKSYQGVAFIARHGSWNREKKSGYDVVMAHISGGKATIEPFMTGLLDEKTNAFFGRPAYVFQMRDGSLLVSDEDNGASYRISYGVQGPAQAR